MKQHFSGARQDASAARHYRMFAVNMGLGSLAMYLVMFSMIDGWRDFRNNLNMLYMAVTMAAPMGLLMLATMGGMYPDKPLNAMLYVGLSILFVAALTATRNQSFIDDGQFVDSMIPHHSGAILMCREARLTDPELVKLCGEIVRTQREEIRQMEAIAARLKAASR